MTREERLQAVEAALKACEDHWNALRVVGNGYGQAFERDTRPLDPEWYQKWLRLHQERTSAEEAYLKELSDD